MTILIKENCDTLGRKVCNGRNGRNGRNDRNIYEMNERPKRYNGKNGQNKLYCNLIETHLKYLQWCVKIKGS